MYRVYAKPLPELVDIFHASRSTKTLWSALSAYMACSPFKKLHSNSIIFLSSGEEVRIFVQEKDGERSRDWELKPECVQYSAFILHNIFPGICFLLQCSFQVHHLYWLHFWYWIMHFISIILQNPPVECHGRCAVLSIWRQWTLMWNCIGQRRHNYTYIYK